MATKLTWAVRLFGVTLVLAPAFVSVARADDDTPKPTTRGEGNPGGGQRRGGGQILEGLHKIVTGLDLTDEQKPKIEAAFSDAKSKMKDAVKDAAGDRQAMRGKVQPIFKELIQTINGILTPEQKTAFEKARPKQGQRGNGSGNGAGNGDKPAGDK